MVQKEAYEALEHKIMALRKNSRTGDERKTLDEVFDRETILGIYKLMTDGYIDTIQYPVSTGKEGNVFAAADADGKLFALKVYRTSNATFNRIAKYIEGDKRFRGLSGSRRKIIFAWASKEFRNLQRMEDAGIRVPSPIRNYRNMLVMQYIGNKTGPAPLLRQVTLDDPEEVYSTIIEYMRLAYQEAKLVHADLSEYNILYYRKKPVIIDVGQAVLTDHPNAKDFLLRDIENVSRYFRGLEVNIMSKDEALRTITEASK
jgi:RIO kinase 1